MIIAILAIKAHFDKVNFHSDLFVIKLNMNKKKEITAKVTPPTQVDEPTPVEIRIDITSELIHLLFLLIEKMK